MPSRLCFFASNLYLNSPLGIFCNLVSNYVNIKFNFYRMETGLLVTMMTQKANANLY